MKNSARLYDVIRIDHFLGIIKYYTIPYDMPDARQGSYEQGPGQKLLDAVNESIGNKKIIAEDLGVSIPEVEEVLEYNNYPGMKVLEFAFGGDRKNPHLPYITHIIVYAMVELMIMKHFLDTLMKEMMVNWDMHMIIWTQEISAVWLIWFSVQHIPALQYSLYFLFRTY